MGTIARDEATGDAYATLALWQTTAQALACELAAVRGHLAAIECALRLMAPTGIPKPRRRHSGREERDAVGLRLVPPLTPGVPAAPPALSGGLSPREVEVLRLIAAGCSNREMAAILSRSERTVERHIENIYHKIGAHNKAEATAYALRRRLA